MTLCKVPFPCRVHAKSPHFSFKILQTCFPCACFFFHNSGRKVKFLQSLCRTTWNLALGGVWFRHGEGIFLRLESIKQPLSTISHQPCVPLQIIYVVVCVYRCFFQVKTQTTCKRICLLWIFTTFRLQVDKAYGQSEGESCSASTKAVKLTAPAHTYVWRGATRAEGSRRGRVLGHSSPCCRPSCKYYNCCVCPARGREKGGGAKGGWGEALHSHHSPNLLLAWPAVTFGMFYGPGPTIAVKYKMALCDSFAAIRGRSRFLTG